MSKDFNDVGVEFLSGKRTSTKKYKENHDKIFGNVDKKEVDVDKDEESKEEE